jgi:hypothetical protein
VTTLTGVRIVRVGGEQRRDRARKYKIIVDGVEAGAVGAGEEVVVPLEAGQHNVRLKIDWLGSDTLTVRVGAGEIVPLACRPNGTAGATALDLLRGTFGRKPWVELSPVRG